MPAIAGVGPSATLDTIVSAQAPKAAGAGTLLVVTPYYIRPSQEGLSRHFEAVARAVDLPILFYNVPARTGVDPLPATVGRLAGIGSIVGIKDATGDLDRPRQTCALVGESFTQFSGNDGTILAFNSAGGQGCISVLANATPRLCGRMQNASIALDMEQAAMLENACIHSSTHWRWRPIRSRSKVVCVKFCKFGRPRCCHAAFLSSIFLCSRRSSLLM